MKYLQGLKAGHNEETAFIGVRIPEVYKEEITRIAHELGITHSSLIRHILTAYVDNEKKAV